MEQIPLRAYKMEDYSSVYRIGNFELIKILLLLQPIIESML